MAKIIKLKDYTSISPKIDKFSKHEVLDRAFLCMDMFERAIFEHPALKKNKKMKKKASKILGKMYKFYCESAKLNDNE